jgi:hypothetical protein
MGGTVIVVSRVLELAVHADHPVFVGQRQLIVSM